jgi:beta-galactosidase
MRPVLALCLGICLEPSLARESYSFNPAWKLLVGDPAGAQEPGFSDQSWQSVSLPRAWNEDDAFHVSIDEHRTGIAWYRKRFSLPESSTGKKVIVEFEGVRQGAEIYLNGKLLGRHENGVMAFGIDLTPALLPAPAENVLAVRTDNSWEYREKDTNQRFQWQDKNFNANFGGIPKNVILHVMDPVYQTLPLYSNLGTTGTYIYPSEINISGKSATIHVESEVMNGSDKSAQVVLETKIFAPGKKEIARFESSPQGLAAGQKAILSAAGKAENLEWWSWGYGYLYEVVTTLKIDGKATDPVTTVTGFRSTSFDHGRVTLNGRVIQLKGYAQRTSNEWPAIGISVPPWVSDYSNGLMVESGANLVRWMHVTPWKQDVESCDRVGLIQAMPAGDAEKDVTGARWDQRTRLMRDAIIYNRNNPSILFYECGNNGISEEHMQEMKALKAMYDPHGGRAIGSRDMLDSKEAEYGGEMLYINQSAHIPFWSMEYSRDEGLRKYWDAFTPPYHPDGEGPLHKGQDASVYNRNQDSHAIEDVSRWYDYWRERPGTGNRVNAGGVNIVFSDTNTHFRGAENYRRSGEVDAMRLPKDGFWAHWVMWDGWVDREKPRTRIIGHWNYAPNVQKPIHVISNGDEVELLLNGRSLGKGKREYNFLFTFDNVKWEPGKLTAISRNSRGQEISRHELETAGAPAAIRLSPLTGPGGLRADGADLALVTVEVIDAQGRRCPTALNTIHFQLDGPAEWRGGIAQGPDNYILSKDLPVECGVNRISLRSLPTAGKVQLAAKADGLTPAKIELSSTPVPESHGLAADFPASHIVPSLSRGPTPAGPSYADSLVSIPIVSATAGINAEQAALSYDDNEKTVWDNQNQLDKGWIRYEFAQTTNIDEIELKLAGWRDRRYPLVITVDDKIVWKDTTVPNLGYFHISLPAGTRGKSVRVALSNASKEDKEFSQITEVADQKNASTGGEKLGKGSLRIHELEFLKKVAKP